MWVWNVSFLGCKQETAWMWELLHPLGLYSWGTNFQTEARFSKCYMWGVKKKRRIMSSVVLSCCDSVKRKHQIKIKAGEIGTFGEAVKWIVCGGRLQKSNSDHANNRSMYYHFKILLSPFFVDKKNIQIVTTTLSSHE